MEKVNFTLKSKLNMLGERCYGFFYSWFFPVYIALLVTICHICNLPLLSLTIISLFASFIFVCYKDNSPIIPLLFMVVMAFNDYDIMNKFTSYIPLLPAIITFLARFFIYPIKLRKPGKLFFPLIAVTLAFALAGITRSDYNFLGGIAFTIALGPTLLLIYLFFSNYIKPPKNFCIKKYLCYNLVITGLAMIVQIVINYIIFGYKAELGWANINAIAAFLCLSVPSCYYLIIKAKNILPWYILLMALYSGVFLSGSDATLGFVIFYSPLLILFAYRNINRKNRKLFIYLFLFTSTAMLTSAIVLILVTGGVEPALKLLQISFSDSGRNILYETAILLFKENPLFGFGHNFDDGYFSTTSPLRLYNFHSTLLHVLATMGIFGIFVYLYYFINRFKILLKKHTPFNIIMIITFVLFESYGMLDTCEFNAIPLMSALTVLITIVELSNKKGSELLSLPLSLNIKRFNF